MFNLVYGSDGQNKKKKKQSYYSHLLQPQQSQTDQDAMVKPSYSSFSWSKDLLNRHKGDEEPLKMKKINRIKENYRIGKIIGKGSSSQVRKATHREMNNKCAIKLIRKSEIDGQERLQAYLNNELQILQKIKHPNILNVYELVYDSQYICIVSQLFEHGSLFKYCVRKRQ